MTRPVLYIAVTSHGFGHTVRVASVAAQIQRLNPDILLVFVTTAPRWLIASYVQGDFIHRPRAFDVGVIQADSFQMDKTATLEKLQHIYAQRKAIIAGEVNFIKTNKVGLVLADIPPLASLIARAADIPGWMMSNFGWDFIYRDWGDKFIAIAEWISECYAQCQCLFRLPLAEPMSAFPNVIDVGLTGGDPHYSVSDLRTKFQISAPQQKTVLLTFGGLGLQQIPYQSLDNFPDWQFITFDPQAPQLPNLLKITDRTYRPVDFMPLCDRIVSKPGYSTFAEAMRLGIPIISLTRAGFAEAPVLLAGLENHSWHQILPSEEFFSSNWEFLHQPLQSPRQGSGLATDGNEVIAQAVVDYFQRY